MGAQLDIRIRRTPRTGNARPVYGVPGVPGQVYPYATHPRHAWEYGRSDPKKFGPDVSTWGPWRAMKSQSQRRVVDGRRMCLHKPWHRAESSTSPSKQPLFSTLRGAVVVGRVKLAMRRCAPDHQYQMRELHAAANGWAGRNERAA